MRKPLLSALWLAAVLAATACGDRDEATCPEGYTCTPDGQGGGGGGVATECIPSQAMGVVGDSCGVFVAASGNDSNGDGTQAKPYRSIAVALANTTSTSTIYLCNETFDGSVSITDRVTLFGGLDCKNTESPWKYEADTKSTLTGDANVPALTIESMGKVVIEDVAITAPDASEPGASSIAVAVEATEVEFHRCDLTAGNGANGEDGIQPPDVAMLDGTPGDAGVDSDGNGVACSTNTTGLFGGNPGNKTCAMGNDPGDGGRGGAGTPDGLGGAGNQGGPDMMGGAGGTGEGGMVCTPGGIGSSGTNGMPGTGASGIGTLSEASYQGVDGTDGLTPGTPGKGGGGGGGAKQCGTGNAFAGPSGGGGGSGGCGGEVGKGGLAGGSSIALLSRESTITLHDSSLIVGNGGKGGDGSDGQAGGAGGEGGALGGPGACAGGAGGPGGNGGVGGGGLGGHSVGVAYIGSEPTLSGGTAPATPKLAGEGGLGGGMDTDANGTGGLAEASQGF